MANLAILTKRRLSVETTRSQITSARTNPLPSPQDGPQYDFLGCAADIVIYGGAAGGGKTWALLREAARHRDNPGMRTVIFRRTATQVRSPGGLWDAATALYPLMGGVPNRSEMYWRFPGGGRVAFAHLQHADDVLGWMGSELSGIFFDELTHFEESQFWYLLSRLRSTSGIKPYIRSTCNPAPGWVRELLAPWVQQGYEGPGGKAQSGEVRYFVRLDGAIVWVDAWHRDAAGQPPKSITFIRSTLYDNKILMDADPAYLSNLLALPEIDRKRLLEGDWDVFEGAYFSEWSEYRHSELPTLTPGVEGYRPPQYWQWFGGLDWGYGKPFAFVLCSVDEHGTVRVVDSIKRAGLTNDGQADLVSGILSKWGVAKADCLITCDPAMWAKKTIGAVKGEADIEAYHRAGLQCGKADNTRLHGWGVIRKLLHAPNDDNGVSAKFRVWKGFCSELIRLFPLMQFEEGKEDMDTTGDDHLHDALRYALSLRPEAVKLPDPPKKPAMEGTMEWELEQRGKWKL